MKVIIKEYNNNWEKEFLNYKKEIQNLFNNQYIDKDLFVNLYHIGSTSISSVINGLKAKPIIDVLLVVSDIKKLDSPIIKDLFKEIGFESRGEYGIPGRRYFVKDNIVENRRVCQIHSFQFDNLYDIERHLNFRDYLIEFPSICKQYSELKETLIANGKTDIGDYCDGKDEFIKKIEKDSIIWKLKNKK